MIDLFTPVRLGNMSLANRFVRSATWLGLATEEGEVTARLIDTMVALAQGQVGLIISGHAYVVPEGRASFQQVGVYQDSLIPGLTQMVQAVHAAGGKFVLQLAHAGCFGRVAPPLVVSDFPQLSDKPRQEMSAAYLASLPAAYAAAARRARAAGCDGVQIHAAHGYLLSQFLSPWFNRRTDEYGGAVANRCRPHLEVLRAVRAEVGPDYPVLMKINGRDYIEGGLELADTLEALKILAPAGLTAVELSGGLLTQPKTSPSRFGVKRPDQEAYFRAEAKKVKETIDLPLILVGGMRTLEVAQEMVDSGTADFISLCRPLIREPGLVARWASGDRRPATCLSDNQCFAPGMAGKGVYCVVEHPDQE
ncbi:MAG: NADH:flavin oxidoreductase [Deltaproteobacteria bacterium]|nr:NADH:flavin oxidoreductase [Deltaproteobacteria bacterium]